jgi:cation-transporting ATPase 13A3/4/5
MNSKGLALHRNQIRLWLMIFRLSDLVSDLSSKPFMESSAESVPCSEKYLTIVRIMATCHSLRVVDDELLGDPLDVKMFEFTGWSFEEGGGHAPEHQSSEHETIVPSVARPPGYNTSVDSSGHMNVSSYPNSN